MHHLLCKIKSNNTKLSLYDSALLINADHWNEVVNNSNIYLSLEYLIALEKGLQGKMEFRYVIFYNNLLKPIAAAYVQIIHFLGNGLKYRDLFCKVGDTLKNKLLQSIDAKFLICGNVFACGENGFAYTSEIKAKDAFELIAKSMKRLTQDKEKNGQISFALFKEYWPKSIKMANNLKKNHYKEFMIDQNMVMTIPNSWKTMDDYLFAMVTKFRTKAKGVYKKSEGVSVKNFELNDIVSYKNQIEELYNAVVAKAEYKFGELSADVFANFKKYLKKQFIFKAYFFNKKMVGFSSVFYFNNIVDANYIGLDYTINKEYAIYQRMLYDFVELSIELGANELRLGRTAELIKSSIGAEPVNMQLYIKHRNGISNKLLAPFISSISPSKFEVRSPFKRELNTIKV